MAGLFCVHGGNGVICVCFVDGNRRQAIGTTRCTHYAGKRGRSRRCLLRRPQTLHRRASRTCRHHPTRHQTTHPDRARRSLNVGSKAEQGVIYFLRAGNGGSVKIGWSLKVSERITALQAGQPFKLVILRQIPAERWVEKWLHWQFKEGRLNGEWFTFHPDMLSIEPPAERPYRTRKRTNKTNVSEQIAVRMPLWLLADLDAWRNTQPEPTSRAEAVRLLLVASLAHEETTERKKTAHDQPTKVALDWQQRRAMLVR